MPRTEFETQEFYDYARIVDPSIPQMLQFAEQMANLSRRLLGKYYDPAKHDFRFLLSDEADANAFTIPKSKPPIVVLTRGLLQGAKTLDEIAGVLGHELGHIMAEQVFGDLKVGNSKAEEMGADLWAVHLLTEAGFDPKGLQDFLTRLPQDSDFETRIMLALTDVHPLTHNRASAMEKARIALARQGFNVEHPSSPVPQALLDILHHLPFEYSEHSPVSVERRASYEGLSTTDQLERVVAEMQRVRDMAIPEAFKVEYGKHLISDILDRIAVNESEVNLNGVAKTMSRLSNIVEKIGGATAYAGAINGELSQYWYATTLRKYVEAGWERGFDLDTDLSGASFTETLDYIRDPDRTIPSVAEFDDRRHAVYDFIEATDRASAIEYGRALIEAADAIPAHLGWAEERMEKPTVDLPSPKKVADWLKRQEEKTPSRASLLSQLPEFGSNPSEVPLLRHHTWLLQEAHPDLLEATQQILGNRYQPYEYQQNQREVERRAAEAEGIAVSRADNRTAGILQTAPVAEVIRPGRMPFNMYFARFDHVDGVAYAVHPAPPAVQLPASIARWPELSLEEMIRLEPTYCAERLAFERDILAKGVPWNLLTEYPEEFFRIYKQVITVTSTSTSFEHPFAAALIEKINSLAVDNPQLMTQKLRGILFEKITALHERGVEGIYGINPDHPYIREEQRLGLQHEITAFWPGARIDPFGQKPFAVLEHVGIDSEFVEGYEHKASIIETVRAVADVQRLLAQPAALDQFVPLSAHRHALSHLKITSLPQLQPQFAALDQQIEAAINLRLEEMAAYDPKKIIETYNATPFAFHPDLERQYVERMFGVLETLPPQALGGTLEGLFKNRTLDGLPSIIALRMLTTKGTRLHFEPPTIALQNQYINIVVRAITAGMSKDDGSENYRLHACDTLLHYVEQIPATEWRGAIIAKVADQLEAQPELAAKLKEIYYKAPAIEIMSEDKDYNTRAIEAVFEAAKSDAHARASSVEFYTSPLTEASVERYIESSEEFVRSTIAKQDLVRSMLSRAHARFWDQPLPVRTALLGDLIFPPQESAENHAHTEHSLLRRLLGHDTSEPLLAGDFLTPANMQARMEEKRKEIKEFKTNGDEDLEHEKQQKLAKLQQEEAAYEAYKRRPQAAAIATPEYNIVTSYLTAAGEKNPAEKLMLISALAGAEQSRPPGEIRRLGQTLNIVLSQMGPAGAKMLQSIHSHPATPEDVREDLKYSKIAHEKPLRWDAIDLVRNAGLLDASHSDPIAHIGPILGAGSFGITIEAETQSGAHYADTMLRPRALPQTLREFDLMARAAELLMASDPRMTPVIEMIQEARHTALVETNMSLAAKQNEIAKQSYDGVQTQLVDAEGNTHTFTHRVADLSEHNEHYKRVGIASGNDFEHLKGKSESYRHAAGYSVITAQLSLRLAGMPVDRDRHGGNVKIEGNVITHFDFGRMDLAPASREQKEVIGRILANALLDVAAEAKGATAPNGGFSAHLNRHIDAGASTPEMKLFLSGFRSEILALGDAFRLVETDPAKNQMLSRIVGQALYSDSTDPVIRESFDRTLGVKRAVGAKFKLLDIPGLKPDVGSVEVSGVRTPDQLKLPTLTLEEAKLTHNPGPILPHRLATQRRAIESGAGNGIGVAMGAYGLWDKFSNQESGFNQDMQSGDLLRQTLALQGAATDVVNIGAGAVSTAADMKTIQQAKLVAPAPQMSVSTGAAPVANVPASPAAPATAPAVNAPATSTAPATPPQAQGGTNTGSAAQQAEKAATEALKDAANTAQKLSPGTEKLLKYGKIAGKAAIPLAVAAGTFDASAGARAGDRERVAGAVGGTAGGILGGMAIGMAAGAATGAIWGSAVPGVGTIVVGVAAGLVGGIAGAVAGEEAAKHYASGLIGKLMGSDDKFLEAMKQLDAATQRQFAKDGKKLTLDDVHDVLKSGKMDSVAHVDTDKSGKLSAPELKQALEKARATFSIINLLSSLVRWNQKVGVKILAIRTASLHSMNLRPA